MLNEELSPFSVDTQLEIAGRIRRSPLISKGTFYFHMAKGVLPTPSNCHVAMGVRNQFRTLGTISYYLSRDRQAVMKLVNKLYPEVGSIPLVRIDK